jgi:hypothetical protein
VASSSALLLSADFSDCGVRSMKGGAVRKQVLVVVAVSAALLPASAFAATKGKVFFEDTIPSGSSSAVTIQTHRAASFRVLLRVPTAGKARLYLLGKTAPKGGPLITTSNASPAGACEGAAGSFYCKASYEALPKGKYTWRITWVSTAQAGPKTPAHVELTVRW